MNGGSPTGTPTPPILLEHHGGTSELCGTWILQKPRHKVVRFDCRTPSVPKLRCVTPCVTDDLSVGTCGQKALAKCPR